MFQRFIYVVARINTYFITFYGQKISHNVFIHSSVDEHLGCFYLLAICHNAATNIHVQVSMWIGVFISLEYVPGNGIVRSESVWGTASPFSKAAVPFTSHQQYVKSPVAPRVLQYLRTICLFDSSHPNSFAVVSPRGLDLHFPTD